MKAALMAALVLAVQDKHVKWDADFDAGLKTAKQKGAFVVLHFTSEG